MRNALSSSLFAGLLLVAAGCAGGSSDDATSVRIKCLGGQSFCIISCDLGCSQVGCSVTEIAENQRIHFKFSDRVDPASVNSGSISIRTATGVAPDGEFLVVDAEVAFIPRINTINGISTFGFLRNESYIITLAGGPSGAQGVRSLAGDSLTQEFTCTVRASLGVLDGDAQPPSATLVSPTNLQSAPLQPTIVLRFSELIDTTALQGTLGPASPIRIVVRGSLPTGECDDGAGTVLGGVPQLTSELVESRAVTVFTFVPVELPPRVCVTVYITSQVRDLSGRSAVPTQFQFFTLDAPPTPFTVVETFNNAANQDPQMSGGTWNTGARPGRIGGNGRHGSFNVQNGTAGGAPATFVWNLSDPVNPITIPGSQTLSGLPETVTDGRFFFTDFVLPAGTTVKFIGSIPAQIHVRGRVDIQGTIDANAADMAFNTNNAGGGLLPPAPWRLTAFNGRQKPVPPFPGTTVNGQEGGFGGPGGGKGGNGGTEYVSGTALPVNDGQPGQAVQLQGGHAYAGTEGSTAGLGSVLAPANPSAPTIPFIIVNPPTNTQAARRDFSPGGSGGGFRLAGGAPAVPFIAGTPTPVQPALGPAPNGGAAFALFPYPPASAPPGYQSLNHFLIGGSGGGGGGSHLYGSQQLPAANAEPLTESYSAGHGGTGGGGAVAIRAGGNLQVATAGQLLAKGGVGVFIDGDDHITLGGRDLNYGVSSPGGGGSGGSFVLQSGRNLVINGTIDTSGSVGSRTGNVSPQTPYTAFIPPGLVNVIAQGGAGSPGFYRLEAPNAPTFAGTGVPAYLPAENAGVLTDRDANTGDRSLWRGANNAILPPNWLHYEIDVDTDGNGTVDVVYSDSGAAGTQPANDPGGAVFVRFQGADMDETGTQPLPGTITPWRAGVANPSPNTGIAGDDVNGFRFELIYNTDVAPNLVVKELRVFATT